MNVEKFKSQWIRFYGMDMCLVLILGILGAVGTYLVSSSIDPIITELDIDVWFDNDSERVAENMAGEGDHYRTSVHPLFSLISYPPVFILQKWLGFSNLSAIRIVLSGISFLWVSTLFVLLRFIGCRRIDSLLFAHLALFSAAALFWLPVPETYPFGSLSILLALLLAALAQHSKISNFWYVGVGILTFSMTITNWMAGLAVTFVNLPWKRALRVSINVFCIVVILWAIQKLRFSTAAFFLGDRFEAGFVFSPDFSEGFWSVLTSFLIHTLYVLKTFFLDSLVMPNIQYVPAFENPNWPIMSIQQSMPGSASGWGMVAVVLWVCLLGLGIRSVMTIPGLTRFRIVLVVTLLGQLGLHVLYGWETFLYALHWLPLLVVLTALSTLTPARNMTILVTCVLLGAVTMNNLGEFNKASGYFLEHGDTQNIVRAQMRSRPTDPWPRGEGHVILAHSGSRKEEKGYLEPGGSFSPRVGSFGISFWMTDREGKPTIVSDQIPLDKIRQEFSNLVSSEVPEVVTETPYYEAVWSLPTEKLWKLQFNPKILTDSSPEIVVRSVGPAGGPINTLLWDGQALLVNNRWKISLDPVPGKIHGGDELTQDWLTESSAFINWESGTEDGWGFARFGELSQSGVTLLIEDTQSTEPSLHLSSLDPIQVNVPDARFSTSLNAQISHLIMGIVEQQTRPGDPMESSHAWLRDGAYVVVALSRAGKVGLAKELSHDFAVHDFFGGYGAEADAPGLAIWALVEVASRLQDKDFDQWIWPHVQRKVNLILEMATTRQKMYRTFEGPVSPNLLKRWHENFAYVAGPAKHDLIMGKIYDQKSIGTRKVDFRKPILYINAMSYLGLVEAGELAARLNHSHEANLWQSKANDLKQAWQKAFKPPASHNPLTYTSVLWPTSIGSSMESQILPELQGRWDQQRDKSGEFQHIPSTTNFEVAEAHQWLFLNRPDMVWPTLQWFWDHQASPGLYSWGEGSGKKSLDQAWKNIRGWVNLPHVTPHYWTAAEMFLLQLDMLGYLKDSEGQNTLVIGGGIPKDWLQHPMNVEGLTFPGARIGWNWDGEKVHVTVRGKDQMAVVLGPSFPIGTPLSIEYLSL